MESFHFLGVPIPAELAGKLEGYEILTQCSCKAFQDKYKCEHVLLYALAKKGHGIVPQGEDIRVVGVEVGPGRPLGMPNRYGVPYIEVSHKKRRRLALEAQRRRIEAPSSPRPSRQGTSQLMIENGSSSLVLN